MIVSSSCEATRTQKSGLGCRRRFSKMSAVEASQEVVVGRVAIQPGGRRQAEISTRQSLNDLCICHFSFVETRCQRFLFRCTSQGCGDREVRMGRVSLKREAKSISQNCLAAQPRRRKVAFNFLGP